MTMRIHVLSYIDPDAGTGGGEAIVRELLRAGELRGHELSRTHLLNRPRFDPVGDIDLSLLIDVWNQPGHWQRPHRRLLQKIPWTSYARYRRRVDAAMAGSYVHFDNAYVDICDLPYLPCNGEARGPICPFKKQGDRRCFAWKNRRIYEDGIANWFLSPLHRSVVEGRLEAPNELPPARICRPLIDTEKFRAADGPRDRRPIERLYVGPLTEAKGLAEVVERFEPSSVHVVGRAPGGEDMDDSLPEFASRRPPVAPDEMPELLGSAREVLFLPRWPEPQGRIALEAALAGCNLVANDRVGALTFSQEPDDERLYERAADDFWDQLEADASAG
jgi:glycosyltransferase involved in cell wall biosynthesis